MIAPVPVVLALMEIFNATGGPGWGGQRGVGKRGWGAGPPCAWAGVCCAANSTEWGCSGVEGQQPGGLNLGFNQLSGTLPADPAVWGALPQLRSLSMRSNAISGTLPIAMRLLTALEDLNLRHNRISGTLPAGWGPLQCLTHFSMLDNRLSGSIPASVGSLQQLGAGPHGGLDLTSNRLRGRIPATLSKLRNFHSIPWSSGGNIGLGGGGDGNVFACPVPPVKLTNGTVTTEYAQCSDGRYVRQRTSALEVAETHLLMRAAAGGPVPVNETTPDQRPGHYSYAWDVIEHGGERHMFYCGNHDGDFRIRDSIMYRRGSHGPFGWVYGEEKLALPHGGPDDHHAPLPPQGCENEPWPGGACVWDKQHACDPDVVAAEGWPQVGFGLDGEQYQFLMLYLGIHQDSASGPGFPPGAPFRPVEANHIGVAVAHSLSGPWTKRNGALVLGDEWWGVGQASAIALTGTEVLLTYTRGNASGAYPWSGQVRQVLDLRDVQKPIIVKPERAITERGLTNTDASPARPNTFVNAAMLWDPPMHRFWTLREGMPKPKPVPGTQCCAMASSVQLAWIPEEALLGSDSTYSWTVEEQAVRIAPNISNRTHNPGLVSDVLGRRLDPTHIEGVVTSMTASGPGCACLWSYRPFAITFEQHDG
eukprot:COSAG05_NODE_2126_length_3522_cov_3.381245_2_plen_647_part_00